MEKRKIRFSPKMIAYFEQMAAEQKMYLQELEPYKPDLSPLKTISDYASDIVEANSTDELVSRFRSAAKEYRNSSK